jgi:hypothetical protein
MTESTLVLNAPVQVLTAIGTPDVLEATLGNRIPVGLYRHILLLFHISAATTNDSINVAAGANPPAFRGGLGDCTKVLASGAQELYMWLETARFADDDGYIHLTFPAHTSLAGTIEAYGI